MSVESSQSVLPVAESSQSQQTAPTGHSVNLPVVSAESQSQSQSQVESQICLTVEEESRLRDHIRSTLLSNHSASRSNFTLTEFLADLKRSNLNHGHRFPSDVQKVLDDLAEEYHFRVGWVDLYHLNNYSYGIKLPYLEIEF